MSFAIIKTGGKQYKVRAGEILKVERLDEKSTSPKIEFKDVLAYGDDKTAELGSPKIDGAKVEANLVKNGKNRTVLIFKKRRRKNSRRKNGHRQEFSLIKINKIFSKDGKVFSEVKESVADTKKKEIKKEAKTKKLGNLWHQKKQVDHREMEETAPGNIIVRQRGTKIFPGEHDGMGKDHSIFSKIKGTVKFKKSKSDRTFVSVKPN